MSESAENPAKLRTETGSVGVPPRKKIGTHNGSFHCDEALACFLLQNFTIEFKDAEIIRSRDPQVWATCDILVDVGDIYDPSIHRYDHHQRGFSQTLDEKHPIKLSSAGLIYKHFGLEIISQAVPSLSPKNVQVIYYRLYSNFIEALDAIDNGISQFDSTEPATPKYTIDTHLSARVGNLNPAWNDPSPDVDAQFKKAMQLAGSEFLACLNGLANIWLPARSIVESSLSLLTGVDPKGRILVLEQGCPWKQHFFDLEKELNIEGQVKYAVFEDNSGSWRVQSVPLSHDSFGNRAPLPEPWRGKRGTALDEDVNLPDHPGCIFVHHSGFIGGHSTKEGALAMAKKSLELLNL